MMTELKLLLFGCLTLAFCNIANAQQKTFPGADEKTASRSEYFSWINNTNEGTTEEQTFINLEFFKWLNTRFGMTLDIYAFDAGAIDGKNFYGSTQSDRFKRQFPNGFAPIVSKAKEMNTRLGIWGGPDGFGNSPEEEKQRMDMMVSLCRDYHFELFKMDAVCGQLRPEKYDAFDRMMTECRQFSPDLILLNHRLNLGKGMPHSTTFLLGGAETYIDVHMPNQTTAPHHRAGALSRELPPNLTRLTEDHGVCLSSCLDYWEDDLILQAFNRNLILAPEIYGNPWFLRDDEYPLLARIFNLHRQYRDILVSGMVLPEKECGVNAVSRGDEYTRFITLRNLSWEPVQYSVKLDSTVGLKDAGKVMVRTYHPTERIIGEYKYGSSVEVEVLPFRSCLVKLSDSSEESEFGIVGIDYQIIPNAGNDSLIVQLLALPGMEKEIKLTGDLSAYKSVTIDGENASSLLKGKSVKVQFDGEKYKSPYHRKLGDMQECPVPAGAESIYEATCFAADNNSLEVRELKRSGSSNILQVNAARQAFLNQPTFKGCETWDQYLFGGDPSTAFSVMTNLNSVNLQSTTFRLDFGMPLDLDSLVIQTKDDFSLYPLKAEEGHNALVSKDLVSWQEAFFISGKSMKIDFSSFGEIRYVKLHPAPMRISEIVGYKNGVVVDRSNWRASNLFNSYSKNQNNSGFSTEKAWSLPVTLGEIPEGSYLCVALEGVHGKEGAFAGLKIDGEYYGCPDRAPSFRSNVWEGKVRETDRNYTYYFPLSKEMLGKKLEVFVLGFDSDNLDFKPSVYITSYPIPFQKKTMKIY
ncbi:hypothetical protein ACUNWD_06590 [Sunxiuqinia sp. A32]|uniref:hypothetical protein n=1 Tax=Sunxiuqinia sp. A32 TaxID=3461496 RepID=UPI0040453D6D